jgi:hypothetical protein
VTNPTASSVNSLVHLRHSNIDRREVDQFTRLDDLR